MRRLDLLLTPEAFNVGGWHPELDCDNEIFLGVVPVLVFNMMRWDTKRQGTVKEGEGPAFVTRKEMLQTARNKGGLVRGVLLKTLLKAESTRRWLEALDDTGR